MPKNESQNTNLASEFFVASQLLRLGYSVTITLGHTKEIDLIAVHLDGRIITIDVKGLKNKTNWPVKPKLTKENHFYIFLNFLNKFNNLNIIPEIFIVPSNEIHKLLSSWTGKPEVTGVEYKDIKSSKYKNAWDLLFK